jgi:hypothetical protein
MQLGFEATAQYEPLTGANAHRSVLPSRSCWMILRTAPITDERGEFMATPFSALSKFIVGLFAKAPTAGTSYAAETGSPASPIQATTLTLSAFVARVREDATLRAHFAQNPRSVFHEFGIDPTPYRLSERLTDAQLDRFLVDWSRDAGASNPRPAPEPVTQPAPAPVYGPPPGFLKRRRP